MKKEWLKSKKGLDLVVYNEAEGTHTIQYPSNVKVSKEAGENVGSRVVFIFAWPRA
jgi:hypothetical protein